MTATNVVVLVHALIGILFLAGLIGRWIVLGAASRATDLPADEDVDRGRRSVRADGDRRLDARAGVRGRRGLSCRAARCSDR